MTKVNTKKGFSAIFVILVVIVLASIAVAVYFLKQNRSVNPQVNASNFETEPTPDPFSTYLNKEFGFSFRYLPVYEVKENGQNSHTITKQLEGEEEVNVNFAYVSIIPAIFESDGGEIYNFNSNEANRLWEMSVGETKSIMEEVEDTGMQEFYNYLRLPDEVLGGLPAKVYLNEKPWEFPEGTKEIRYYVEKEGYVYLMGAYFNEETENELKAIITSLEFK